MLQFISDNLATILVGFAVAVLLAFSLWAMHRDKKKHAHEGGCGGGCCSCPYAGKCHGK